MKYIETDKLIIALERQNVDKKVIEPVICIINSLQQEQDILVINKKDWEAQEKFRKNKKFGAPIQQEQPEVDLEEEIRRTYHDGSVGDTSDMDHNDYENIARHFYELGRNARQEE